MPYSISPPINDRHWFDGDYPNIYHEVSGTEFRSKGQTARDLNGSGFIAT